MVSSGLPSGWEVRHSNSKNLPYFFHAETKDSRWEPPSGTDEQQLDAFMKAHHASKSTNGGSTNGDNAEQIRAAHLLIKHNESRRPSSWRQQNITRSKQEAREIITAHQERIERGEITLGDLAERESDCSSARTRGDLGFFGRGAMQQEFESAAFRLEPGQISDVVETKSGLHLIQRLE